MPESGVSDDNRWDDCDCDTSLASVGVLLVLLWAVYGLGDAILLLGDALDAIVFYLVVVL